MSNNPSELIDRAGLHLYLVTGLITIVLATGCSPTDSDTTKTSEVETYKGKMLSSSMLYQSADEAKNLLTESLDQQVADAKAGDWEHRPGVAAGEAVTITKYNPTDEYCEVTTSTGKDGWVPYTLVPSSPQEQKKELENKPAVAMLRNFLKNNPVPPLKQFNQPVVAEGVEYHLSKVERISSVGNEQAGDDWAQANDGYQIVVVYYTAKNVDRKAYGYLAQNMAIRDTAGNIYPWDIIASNAIWSHKKIVQPDEVKYGQTIKFADAFYIPNSIPNDHLSLFIPDTSSAPAVYPAQIALR